VLFACLAGRPPFQGQVPEVIQGHLNREAPRLTELVVLPPRIDEVIRRGMAKSPNTRYADCREVIAAARQALAGVPQPNVPAARRMPPPGQPPTANGHGGYSPPGVARPGPPGPPAPPRMPLPGVHSSAADPVRLRPPAPVGRAAFTPERGGPSWVVPVLVGLVAIALIVAAVLFFTGEPGGGGGTDPGSTVPTVQVGPGGSQEAPKSSGRLPTSLPIRPPSSR